MADGSLPLPDYDQLSLDTLEQRIHSLDEQQLHDLVEHERAHGDRVPVLRLLRGRLDQLEAGAEPSPGDQSGQVGRTDTPAGSRVEPGTSAQQTTPLRHGMYDETPRRGRT